jgi:hypothetical protein
MSLVKISVTVLFALVLALVLPSAEAHPAGTFSIIVRDDGIVPETASFRYNDTALWIDVGEDDNLTHRIVYDSDGDGLYNGTYDWDSGTLHNECERDENGTKLDDECQTQFRVTFNSTFGPGTYYYQDLLSDGGILNATLVVNPDVGTGHAGVGFQQPPAEESTPEEEEEGRPNWLLAVAGLSAVGAALLGYLVLQGQPKS